MPEATATDEGGAARIVGAARAGPMLVLCDHAANRIPAHYKNLGLDPADLASHIAWDPGALAVAERLAEKLDAPLAHALWSRLLADCNRDAGDEDLMVTVSDGTVIPGNGGLTADDRQARIDLFHTPYHRTVTDLCDRRAAAGQLRAIIAIHSFTPAYGGRPRPWHVGIIHDDDVRLSAPVTAALAADAGLTIGDNQPYHPRDRVYRTLERHAVRRGLPGVMIEIRNDLVADPAGAAAWADRLATALLSALDGFDDAGTREASAC